MLLSAERKSGEGHVGDLRGMEKMHNYCLGQREQEGTKEKLFICCRVFLKGPFEFTGHKAKAKPGKVCMCM